VLFSGDHLFISGAGKYFEGDAKNMKDGMDRLKRELESNTLICCGHEYTIENLSFTLTLDPSNENAKKKLEWASQRRSSGLPTVPSAWKDELSYNPFLRAEHLTHLSKEKDPVSILAEIRKRKNEYKK
jgi:hydroxyacylglutathione hydrolase